MDKYVKRELRLMFSDKKIPTVLALSGSLRRPSFTDKILDILLKGMGELEVHKFYPHKMKIGPCTKCWNCWRGKHKGECVQKDDFQSIYDVYKKCNYFIIAAPVYVFGFPATVKNVIDRFFVNLEPSQILMDSGITNHPQRYAPEAKGILVSTCGFPDMENFNLMSQHFKKIMMHIGLTWAGEILIPSAGAANFPNLLDVNLEAVRKAGAVLISETISPETMHIISDVPISKNEYREMTNASFKGGLTGKAKTIAIGIKTMRNKGKKKQI
jgi:multimeric flavodoxin WrbA